MPWWDQGNPQQPWSCLWCWRGRGQRCWGCCSRFSRMMGRRSVCSSRCVWLVGTYTFVMSTLAWGNELRRRIFCPRQVWPLWVWPFVCGDTWPRKCEGLWSRRPHTLWVHSRQEVVPWTADLAQKTKKSKSFLLTNFLVAKLLVENIQLNKILPEKYWNDNHSFMFNHTFPKKCHLGLWYL